MIPTDTQRMTCIIVCHTWIMLPSMPEESYGVQKRAEEAALQKQRVKDAMVSGQRIVVDLDFEDKMTEKEVRPQFPLKPPSRVTHHMHRPPLFLAANIIIYEKIMWRMLMVHTFMCDSHAPLIQPPTPSDSCVWCRSRAFASRWHIAMR